MNRPLRLQRVPDARRMAEFLVSEAVVDAHGRVWSWFNPNHPGYPYPEAAAVWLSWAVWKAESFGTVIPGTVQVRRWLTQRLLEHGTVGRDGVAYLFDTSIALDAVIRSGDLSDERLQPADLARGLDAFVRSGRAAIGDARDRGRWSRQFGPHLLKAAGVLVRAARASGYGRLLELAGQVVERVAEQPFRDGRDYCHALAYAAEGAQLLLQFGWTPGSVDPTIVAELFARIQTPAGAVPAWSDGQGEERTDATAQAIRLWTVVDPIHFQSPISAALRFLARLQAPCGGIRYAPASADVNTWVTVFADQALAWCEGGVNSTDWI